MSLALSRCRVLEVLHLDYASLGPEGMAKMSLGLESRPRHFTTITELTVAGNQAGDFGVGSFCHALAHGPTLRGLRRLRLAENELSHIAASALSQAFEDGGGKRLRYLDLSNNPIGDKGAIILAQVMSPATGKKDDDIMSQEMWALSMFQLCKRKLLGLFTGPPPPPRLERIQSSTSNAPEDQQQQPQERDDGKAQRGGAAPAPIGG